MTMTRRRFLAAGSAATLLTLWSSHGMAKAMGTGPQDRRLLVVMLRGALDGLHAVVPQGDADYARLRGVAEAEFDRRLGELVGGFLGNVHRH